MPIFNIKYISFNTNLDIKNMYKFVYDRKNH